MTGKLSFFSKIGYGMGALSESTMQNVAIMMMMPIFNITLGVDPVLLGYAAAVARVWDALTDPVMGYLSDNTRSRWGRRKPYILAGSVMTALAFVVMWLFPRDMGQYYYLTYFVIASLFYYTCTTVYCVPYISYGYELSGDYHERTNLMGYRMFFVGLSTVAINWVFWGTQRPCFAGDTITGMRVVSLIVGAVIVIFALGPLLLTGHEKPPTLSGHAPAPKIKVADIFTAFKVKPFVLIMTGLGTGMLGAGSTGALGTYLIIYYVCRGDIPYSTQILGVNGTVYGLSGIAVLPLVSLLSKHFGKKAAMLTFYGVGIAGFVGSYFIMNPESPYLSILCSALISPCLSAMFMLFFSMMADVCQWDLLHNNLCREGVFAAVLSWTVKVGFTMAMVIAGYILVWCGFDQKLGAAQSADSIMQMRLWYALFPTAFLLIGATAVCFYPLSRAKVDEIKLALAAREK